MAFQLIDDLLDVTATDDDLGKPATADLKLGLSTAPVLFASQQVRRIKHSSLDPSWSPSASSSPNYKLWYWDGFRNPAILNELWLWLIKWVRVHFLRFIHLWIVKIEVPTWFCSCLPTNSNQIDTFHSHFRKRRTGTKKKNRKHVNWQNNSMIWFDTKTRIIEQNWLWLSFVRRSNETRRGQCSLECDTSILLVSWDEKDYLIFSFYWKYLFIFDDELFSFL